MTAARPAVAAAALVAAALAGCGSAGGPAGTAPPATASHPAASHPAAGASQRAHSAADVAFAAGMLWLQRQAAAMTALAAGRAVAPVNQWAARAAGDESGTAGLRRLMRHWHKPVPAPYRPGTDFAGMRPA